MGRRFWACLACSIAVHAAWFGGTWLAVGRAPAGDRRPPRAAPVAVPVLTVPPPPTWEYGSGGEGRGILESVADRPQIAPESFQDQPELAVSAVAPRPAARPGVPSAIEPADRPPLPGRSTLAELAANLERAEAFAAPDVPQPPTARADDRESSAVSETPPTVADYRAGRVTAREGIDFKIIGLRAGIDAYLDAAFLPGGTRVELELVVDADGVPVSVVVVGGSGSEAVDDGVRRAFFQSWFDAAPDEPFRFTLVLR